LVSVTKTAQVEAGVSPFVPVHLVVESGGQVLEFAGDALFAFYADDDFATDDGPAAAGVTVARARQGLTPTIHHPPSTIQSRPSRVYTPPLLCQLELSRLVTETAQHTQRTAQKYTKGADDKLTREGVFRPWRWARVRADDGHHVRLPRRQAARYGAAA